MCCQSSGQPQIDQRQQQRILDALFCPASEADIDRVPLAIAFVHVAPGAAKAQHMRHAVEKTPIIARWPRPTSPFKGQERPDKPPRPMPALEKAVLNQKLHYLGISFVNTA